MKENIEISSIVELLQYFDNENKCREYLEEIRWNGKPKCPHCNSFKKIYKYSNGKNYKCSECKKQFSITKGTVFERSHVSLKLWFVSIYLENSSKKGLSSYQLAKLINCTQSTAWFMLHRIRFAMKNNPNFKKLKGKTFEVDETFIGGKQKNKHYKNRVKGTQGRSTKAKSPVLGILDRETGWVIPLTVWNLRSRGIKLLINYFVEDASSSTLHTDEYRTYRGSTEFFKEHQFVCHGSYQYVNGDSHTNTIEGFWSHLKRSIYGVHHQIDRKKYLKHYCFSTAFKYATRKITDFERFKMALSQSSDVRLSLKELTRK